MAVNLSPVGGVAAQFFTNTGAVLTGGKLYTYAAGTTTPAVTYTSSNGGTPWSNPIVLDAAGRVSGSGEIWLTDGVAYKFVLKDSTDVLIATYDNITGINSNSVAYTNQQEIVTATAGQTVFNLSISYQVGTNSLSVFVDGVNQYGSGAQYAYTETDSNTVTFTSGLHVGAVVKFTTTQQQAAGAVDASQVSYVPAGTGAVTTNVQSKLHLTINVMDFIPTALHANIFDFTSTTDVDTYIQDAIDYAYSLQGAVIWFPAGKFNVANTIEWNSYIDARGVFGEDNTFGVQDPLNGTWIKWTGANTTDPIFRVFNTRMFRLDGFHLDGDNKNVKGIQLDSDNTPSGSQNEFHRFNIRKCLIGFEWGTGGLATPYANDGTRVTTFTIWSQMTGSIGFRINSGNAGQMSTIESGGVQVDSIGIDLICANLLQIRRVFCGGQVRSSFIRAQLPIDVLVEGCSSENWGDRIDGKISTTAPFLLVIPSVEQPAFTLRDFTMTLMNNQCNNPILIQSPIRIVDIGSNFGYCFNPSNVAVAATADVAVGGNGSMVSVINSGTQTWAAGFPYPSGWQPSDYVRLTNLKPESTSLFWGVESAVFPVQISGNDRGLTTTLRNASGGYADFFTVGTTNVGSILCESSRSRYYTTATVFVTSGTGSPEGSVTAPVGSLWTRTDGGASTTLYIKESGTGNTGWVAK